MKVDSSPKNINCVIIYSLSVKHKGRYFEECCQPNSSWKKLTSIVQKKIPCNPMATGSSLITKILQNNFSKQLTEQLLVSIDLNSMAGKNYGSQWLPATVWLPTFFKIYSFVFDKRKTFMQVWYNKVGNDERIFCVNYTFKHITFLLLQWNMTWICWICI